MSAICYRTANQEDTKEIAKTHIKCFENYFISSLGNSLVEKYYLEFIKENDLFIVAVDDNRIIGFCMGYIIDETKARSNFLHNNFGALFIKVFGQCIRLNRRTIKKVFGLVSNKFVKKKSINKIEKHGGDLLSICVLKEYRGQGISTELVEQFERKLIEKGQKEYWLGVYKTNVNAIKFYDKMGLKIETEDEDEYKFHKIIRSEE